MKVSRIDVMTRDNFVQWLLIHVMVRHAEKLMPDQAYVDISKVPGWENCTTDESMDVVLTINGVEVDFMEAMKEMERQSDEWSAREAVELLERKFGQIFDDIQNISDDIVSGFKRHMLEEARNRGVELRFRGDDEED